MASEPPTVELLVEVPVEYPAGGWGWTVDNDASPAGREPVYSRGDLLRVMLTYGAVVGTIFSRGGASAYRVVAKELYTGRSVGTYSFRWDVHWGRYVQESDPFVVWDQRSERIADEVKGGFIEPADAGGDACSHARATDEPQAARRHPQEDTGRQRQPEGKLSSGPQGCAQGPVRQRYHTAGIPSDRVPTTVELRAGAL